MFKNISTFSDKSAFNINNCKVKVQRYAKVHVVLVRARHLAKLNSNGKSSDPYCQISIGKEKVTSNMVSKCINPEWKESFDFNWYAGYGDELKITLWNKNYWDLPVDDCMGNTTIDLNHLEVEETHHIWKRLENGKGQIFILLTISGTTSEDSITNLKAMEYKLERYI